MDQETGQRALAWVTPAGMEDYSAERVAVIAAAGGHPDPVRMNALRIRSGMAFADEPPRSSRPSSDAGCLHRAGTLGALAVSRRGGLR
ncbi:MAG: hypothetical protein K0R44_3735 [Thermomicrobiales bacterium]|jgi:hypothetical protein|nr:hypothetical protein [Thermomicrobiales bacterium]